MKPKNTHTIERNYLKVTELRKEAIRRLAEIEAILAAKEASLQKSPPGKIHIIGRGENHQFYIRFKATEKSGTYISKKDRKTISAFLQKAYDEKVLKKLIKESAALKTFLKMTGEISDEIRKLYSDYPEDIKEMIVPIDCSDEDYVKEWMSIPYEKKPIGEVSTIWTSDRGEQVRSKSELNIANALNRYNIPYKYECPVKLKSGITIHPDFSALNVNKRKVIYWEHRGMMDNPAYATHSVSRIKDMQRSGILLGDNLIITEETAAAHLGTDEIDRVIRHFLM